MKPLHNTASAQGRAKQKTKGFSVSYQAISVVLLSGLLLLCDQSAMAASSPSAGHITLSQSAQQEMFQQALNSDAQGNPQQARQFFDALLGTRIEHQAAVPSAVNFINLGKYPEAREKFRAITVTGTPRDATYAHLWLLWLTARTWEGKPADLQAELVRQASGIHANDAVHQHLIDLYAGKGDVETVMTAVASTGGDEASRNDLFTEAAFFVGGWQQYIGHTPNAAQQLYQRALPLSAASIERPQLEQAIAALQTASR